MGKRCPKCGAQDAEFGLNRARKDGLQVYCRDCMMALRKERAYDAARWASNRESESERNRAYREANAATLKEKRDARRPEQAIRFAARIRAHNIARLYGQRRATPAWADLAAMNALYAEAKRLEAEDGIRRHVDHIVPLKHPAVCGLHAHTNLAIKTAADNMRKYNKFEVGA